MPATKRTIDMTDVKDPGKWSQKHMPEGDYEAIITDVNDAVSNEAKNEMWVFDVQLVKNKKATYPYRCTLDEKSAWKIRALLVAAGLAVPKKRVAIDPNKLKGKKIAVTLEDDTYKERVKSVIQATFPVSEMSDEPDDDDAPDADGDEVDELDLDEL